MRIQMSVSNFQAEAGSAIETSSVIRFRHSLRPRVVPLLRKAITLATYKYVEKSHAEKWFTMVVLPLEIRWLGISAASIKLARGAQLTISNA